MNTISLACSVDERNALDYPYLLKNAHLGHFSSAQNPHYFKLDQLYNIAKDSEEHNNILCDVVGTPKSERQLTQDQKQKRRAMQGLLKEYLGTFADRPFGEFK